MDLSLQTSGDPGCVCACYEMGGCTSIYCVRTRTLHKQILSTWFNCQWTRSSPWSELGDRRLLLSPVCTIVCPCLLFPPSIHLSLSHSFACWSGGLFHCHQQFQQDEKSFHRKKKGTEHSLQYNTKLPYSTKPSQSTSGQHSSHFGMGAEPKRRSKRKRQRDKELLAVSIFFTTAYRPHSEKKKVSFNLHFYIFCIFSFIWI